ncbi:hypothetical protein A3J19_01575 [Candidatus Daviesbacteria bacterium RIFCSPLOWO2_02_FULL_41_8]|uniref:Uncharacterized protein n=2 Tax=Candidatus Daviesiibacteriota TaxID=1752718 RepID=A0A1F5NHS5_9BACT|nr:MAG: hypothetical protein A3D83_00770 [Candidatus Daviesbacteria bacterium RIFCSPHIGHO2_02_FULL_41_10]OGE77178.1 MAG: hypothetical protein A3J19_01575 [Candidatus Daviesbacteria bacterium RIFCSPLOWO2_02_FULL_41_8]
MVLPKVECSTNFMTNTFQGRSNEYDVRVYRSNHGNKASFAEIPECAGLIEDITDLYLGVYPQRDRDKSIERVRKSLSYPRTIVELAYSEDQLVGAGIFPRFNLEGEPLFYSSRFILPDHTRQGLGPYMMEDAILRHQQELATAHRVLRFGAIMAMNPDSVGSLWKLSIVGDSWPIRKPANDQVEPTVNFYPQGSTQQLLMLRAHGLFHMASDSIHVLTGVSSAELSELGMNETYKPGAEKRMSWLIHKIMVSRYPQGLSMNREAGDLMCMVFEILKPGHSETETFLLPAA